MKFFFYFENFAFKAFKFNDRASPLEYWCVMPVIWLLTISLPFVTALLHLFFMISPSKPDHELGGNAPMTLASLRQKGEVSATPL